MAFLDPTTWTSRVFLDGWVDGRGGDRSVVSPSTGSEFGRVGMATPEDVRQAAQRAAEAQRAWAATPHPARAAVLRRAADLFTEHADEIHTCDLEQCWDDLALAYRQQVKALADQGCTYLPLDDTSLVPLEQLALSPQCGFSSTVEGNALTQEDQLAKLRLVVETAQEVGG